MRTSQIERYQKILKNNFAFMFNFNFKFCIIKLTKKEKILTLICKCRFFMNDTALRLFLQIVRLKQIPAIKNDLNSNF